MIGAKVQHFRYNILNERALYLIAWNGILTLFQASIMIQKPLESNRTINHNHRLMLKRMRGMHRGILKSYIQKVKIYPLLLVGSLLSFSASAQFTKYSNEFLNIGAVARGLSMAGPQLASVSEGTAGYWNPAALANIRD